MLYRKVPKNGDKLSILGYGCMRLPQKYTKIDEERAKKQLYSAIDQGVNYVDTAYIYHGGESEVFLGKALSGEYRQKIKLATKLPPFLVKKKEDMDTILNNQLKKLQTDYIDYYLIHGIHNKETWERMINLGVLEFMEKMKKDGKIVNIGFSFHGDLRTFKEIVDAYDWVFCQIQYNYLDEYNQAGTEGLEYAAAKEIAVMVMEPLRGGSLVGKMPAEVQTVWDRAKVKRTPAEWALRWVWNHPEVITVLSGMNEESHIEENIGSAKEAYAESLVQDELKLFDAVKEMYQKLMKVGCTGCAYCMPCPAGVNIPLCFELYNNKYLFKDRLARMKYIGTVGGIVNEKKSYASQCVGCGKCEEVCPQHLKIRDELKKVNKAFEGILKEPLSWIVKAMIKIK